MRCLVLSVMVSLMTSASLAETLEKPPLPDPIFPRRVSWSPDGNLLWFTDEHQTPAKVGYLFPPAFLRTFPVPCVGCDDATARIYIEDIVAVSDGAWFIGTRVGMDGAPLDGGMNSYLWHVDTTGGFDVIPIPKKDAFRRFAFGSTGHSFVTPGIDGRLWFTMNAAGSVGYVDEDRQFKDVPASSPFSAPSGIGVGPDGNAWVALSGSAKIAKISIADVLTEYTLPKSGNLNAVPFGLVIGTNGRPYFTDARGRFGTISDAGAASFAPIDPGQCLPGELTGGGPGEFYLSCGGATTGSVGQISARQDNPFQIDFSKIAFNATLPTFATDLAWNGIDRHQLWASVFQRDGTTNTDTVFAKDEPPRCDLRLRYLREDLDSEEKRYVTNVQYFGVDIMDPISVKPEASGGTPPYTITLRGGLPDGMFYNGALTFAPSDEGDYVIWFSVQDSSQPRCETSELLYVTRVESPSKRRTVRH